MRFNAMRTLRGVLALALGLSCLVPRAVQAQDGPWYGGYAADLPAGAVAAIEVDLTQFAGQPTGLADFRLTGRANGTCPETMHPEFCDELALRAARQAQGDASALGVRVFGVRLERDVAHIAFAFADRGEMRLLELRPGARGYQMAVYHPARGLDMRTTAWRRAHPCQTTRCPADPRIEALRRNPYPNLGLLADVGFAESFPLTLDRIAEAHRDRRPPVPPTPSGLPDMSGIGGTWRILDDAGREVGLLAMRLRDREVMGRGVFYDRPGLPPRAEVQPMSQATAPDRVQVEFFVHNAGGGDTHGGSLVMAMPVRDGRIRAAWGKYGQWLPVTLYRDGPFDAGRIPWTGPVTPPPPKPEPPKPQPPEPKPDLFRGAEFMVDTPTQSRNVLEVHAARAISSVVVGRLEPGTMGIRVLECTRGLTIETFRRPQVAGNEKALRGGWCEIEAGRVKGWVQAFHLALVGYQGWVPPRPQPKPEPQLRDVPFRVKALPQGRDAVPVHAGRAISSNLVGGLGADARGIEVTECEPRLTLRQFRQPKDPANARVLEKAWCAVRLGKVKGWAQAKYLTPQR